MENHTQGRALHAQQRARVNGPDTRRTIRFLENSQVSGKLFVCRNNFSGTGPGRQEAGTGSKEIPGCGKIVSLAKQLFLTETISFSIIGVQVVSKIVE